MADRQQLGGGTEDGGLPVEVAFAAGETTHVTGIAYAYPLPAMAERAALSYCEERRIDRGIEAPCETYATGDEIVAAPATDESS